MLAILAAVVLNLTGTDFTHEVGVAYSSSIDAIDDLYMDLCYPTDGVGLPILVIMHGFGGDRHVVTADWKERVAAWNLFVVAVDMRGRSISGGAKDCGAREIHDIYDAIETVKVLHADRVDARNVNLVGYSGGGANALSVATKFPDLCGVIVAHFGISDYGWDPEDGWWYTTPGYRQPLEEQIGGTPMAVGDAYRARMSVAAARNNSHARIRLYHDVEDIGVPVVNSENWMDAITALGLVNSILNRSGPGDDPRWIHGYPIVGTAGEPNIQSESEWIPEILSGRYRDASIDETGDWAIAGYVRCERFRIFLGDGTGDMAGLHYDLSRSSRTVFTIANKDTANDVTAHFDLYHMEARAVYCVTIERVSTGRRSVVDAVSGPGGTVSFAYPLAANDRVRFTVVRKSDLVGG